MDRKKLTPMMRQYFDTKDKYSDCLLFYRLGDFYEMFFDDAQIASKELELTLTGRDCGLSERAPMCGVPYHSVDAYINKLIDKGYKVAICEQIEDPALAKGLVDRDVVRVITPGTVIEDKMLEEGENRYIAAILFGEVIGLSYADVSTGAFFTCQFTGEGAASALLDELARIRPKEVLGNEALFLQPFLSKKLSSQYYLQQYGGQAFALETAKSRLLRHFHISALSGFGCSELPCAVSAAGALMQYLEETQKNALSHINKLTVLNRSQYMQLDASTRRNLELTQPLRFGASKKYTLFALLDSTKTAMGSRMLRDWIDRPLQDKLDIERRQDAVEELANALLIRKTVQSHLAEMYDMERLCSKIVYGTVNARDCIALATSLSRLPQVVDAVTNCSCMRLLEIRSGIDLMTDILELLCRAIHPNPPIGVKDGDIIREGYSQEVDELRAITHGSKQWLADFETREKERAKIKNLRIGFNRVFGYYIEITKSNLSQVPYDYERRQTLANAERYITPELKQMEQKILGAQERLIALEYELFAEIRSVLLACTERLQQNAAWIAELDCYQSLADVAATRQYCRPAINTEGRIRVLNGRHPVIERAQSESFIPNDVMLDDADNRLLIITGPNMAGKSTYMRQVALISLMAHVGSFVPASEADIAIIDRIFTRIGASDDLSSGQSTFMVEMSEMANIINNATADSLLILDEIGRGTSTFDGLSIAWAVLEYIASKSTCGAKTLFATHYHELTELEGKLEGIKNYRITVKEIGDDIVFLRKIARGSGDKSFGVQVARLAGLPQDVLCRAKEILSELENADIAVDKRSERRETAVQVSLFDASVEDSVLRTILELDIEHLTPMDALNHLYSLKTLLKRG